MPVGELVAEVLGGAIRLLGHIIFEIVVETLIRGVGYAIWRRVSPRTDPEDWPALVVGVLFWAIVAGLGYLVWPHMAWP